MVDERITFIFDRNKEFGGRAAEWYQMVVDKPLARHHLKLGTFSQDDRATSLGLQAADMLAYAAFRHFRAPDNHCWQWEQLHQAAHIVEYVADSDFWNPTEAAPSSSSGPDIGSTA